MPLLSVYEGAGVHSGLIGSFFFFFLSQTEKDLLHKEASKVRDFSSLRCSRFRSAPPPLSDFGERLLELFATVLCTKTCSLLVQKSSLLRCLTVSFRRNPTSRECRKPDCPGACSVGLFVPSAQAAALPGTTVLEHAPPRRPANNGLSCRWTISDRI